MVELVTCNFWWLEVTKEVKQYIEECNAYQRNKNCTEQPAQKLMPNSIPEKPWMHISVDFITYTNYKENISRRISKTN